MTAQSDTTNTKPTLESLLWDGIEYDEHEEILRNKREDAGIELCGLLHQAGISRAELARQLDWKPSRVTRALSGNENLTLNTLTQIINATGMDYDLVFRKKGTCRAFQPWELGQININVRQLTNELNNALGEVKHLHQRASITLDCAREVSRAMFRRASEMKFADSMKNSKQIVTKKITYEENDEAICVAA